MSRQIARLEQSLGTSLFHRTRSSAELTSAGRTLHSATRAGFSLISDAVDEVGERPGDRVVVDVSTSFATLWLLEHLDEFVTAHPEVDVRVSTRHENLSASADADVSVVFATQADAPERAVCVMPERLVVICASTASVGPDLRSERLLGLDLPLHRADWSIVLDDPPTIDLWYTSYTVYLQAVVAGHGVGLGWSQLVQRRHDDGSITLVNDVEVSTSRGYFAHRSNRTRPHRAADQMIDWMAAAAG